MHVRVELISEATFNIISEMLERRLKIDFPQVFLQTDYRYMYLQWS